MLYTLLLLSLNFIFSTALSNLLPEVNCRTNVTTEASAWAGIFSVYYYPCRGPVLVATQSKMWVYGRPLAGIVGSNPAGGMDVRLVCVVR